MCVVMTNPQVPHHPVAVQTLCGCVWFGHTAHAAFHSSIVKVALRTRETDPEVVVSHGLIYSHRWDDSTTTRVRNRYALRKAEAKLSCVCGGNSSIAYLLWLVKGFYPSLLSLVATLVKGYHPGGFSLIHLIAKIRPP